jgi:hypothetical protein
MIKDALKLIVYSSIALCVGIIGGTYVLFPDAFKWLWNIANLSWARTSAKDIGTAFGKMVKLPLLGSVLEGVLLGLVGVWILLKTGSLEKIREYGALIGGGAPESIARAIAGCLFPVMIVGTVAIGIAKLDLKWTTEALKGYILFISGGNRFVAGVMK